MEFDKRAFANILKTLCSYYGSITKFANKSLIDRTYISKYIHECRKDPPSPKILRKIANSSDGLFSYLSLMYICGYFIEGEYDILKGERK